MNVKTVLISAIICVAQLHVNAQNQSTPISIPNYVKLLEDSILSNQLITDLNSFMIAAQKANEENEYVLPSQRIETNILIDEFKGIERSRGFKDAHFYKPYLKNVIKLAENQYLIQLSHIGVNDSIPYLRTSYNLIAHQENGSFLFSSPLVLNTKDWKSKTIENCTFYYKKTLNTEEANSYVKRAAEFDAKLGSTNKTTKLYCAKNRTELLKLIGVDYKLDYNGRTSGVFSALNGDEQLLVLGNDNEDFNHVDPHDLWHDRLSLVISRRKVNKPVDEGCAYLYGGSWGLSWDDIFNQFMNKIGSDKKSDWLFYKENSTNFVANKRERLMVDYVVTALIIQKIEKEKGFSGVWQLLNAGPYEKGNENYFKVLNELLHINKKNYNKEVWKLIKQELEEGN